jgi:hypothetical protein
MNPEWFRSAVRWLATATLVAALPGTGSTRVHAQQADGKECTADSARAALIDVADDVALRVRADQLRGSAPLTALTIRRPALERSAALCATAPGDARFDMLPVRVRTIYNSGYPLDVNNGAMWAGRGASGAVSAGGELRIGPFSAAVYPVLAFHQNREFQLTGPERAGYSRFTYAGHVIDWPQRHGGSSFTVIDPGQSYARLDAFGATVGVSTENMWLGPAQRMPLLMGSSAAGFPHAFLGTSRPLSVGIGRLEAQAYWGRLSESAWFDTDRGNDHTLIAGLSVVFEPAFARGLFLGGNRSYLAPMQGSDLASYLVDPYVSVRDNPAGDNQLFSLYARWALPQAGFEVYGEWAREDHWGEWLDLLSEPDHSQAYMLGFQKVGTWGQRQLRWFGELVHLTAAAPLRGGRGVITFYTHAEVIQGYTHRGQLLGAWTGPGSDAQILGVEMSTPRRSSGLAIERVRFDADAYWNQWGRFYGETGHDVSLGALLRHAEHVGEFSIHAAVGFARRHNRNFAYYDGAQPPNFQSESNVQLDLDLRWRPAVLR